MTSLLVNSSLPLWKQLLRQNFTRIDQLANFLELSNEQRVHLFNRPNFPLNIPLRLAKKIKKRSLDDPLLRQFVPMQEEQVVYPNFFTDPVGDAHCRRSAKLLHKYQGRVLLVCTSACAMHCRYCFRQNFDYEINNKDFSEELNLILKDSSIQELILSGGDPLSLSDDRLAGLLGQMIKIPHLKRIRFHTRFPIGIPERIDDHFLQMIAIIDRQIWFVIHVNHPSELDEEVFNRLKELQKIGCTILNQSVLLKGVNDDLQTLKELCEQLIDHGIMPYYLHQLDRVQGAAHFEVEEDKGRDLIRQLSACLPGYAVPKYVREILGEPGKTLLL